MAAYLVPFGQLVSNQEGEVSLWHILETAGNGQRERNAMLQLAPKYFCFEIRNILASFTTSYCKIKLPHRYCPHQLCTTLSCIFNRQLKILKVYTTRSQRLNTAGREQISCSLLVNKCTPHQFILNPAACTGGVQKSYFTK